MGRHDPAGRPLKKFLRGRLGLDWFTRRQADLLIDHMMDEGWYIVRRHDLIESARDEYDDIARAKASWKVVEHDA